MQYKAVYLLFCKFTLHASGVNHIHHQEYTKLQLQPSVLVIFFVQLRPSGTGLIFCAAASLQSGQANLATLEGGSCTVPEVVVTVLCTPDDECG